MLGARVPAPIPRCRIRAGPARRPSLPPGCLIVLLLLLLAFPAAPAPPSPATAPRIPLALRDDPRLDAPVTVAEVYRPLPEILASVQRQCHVKLAASPAVADDKATLFLDAKPVREAMALLARHFDFSWRRSGSGYELTQDLDARRRETALRSAELAREKSAIDARLALIRQLSTMPAAQMEARQQDIERQIGMADLAPEQRAQLAEEKAAIADLRRAGGAASAAIYASLTPAQREELEATGDLRLSTSDQTLPPSLGAAVERAVVEHSRNLEVAPGVERPPEPPPAVNEYARVRLTVWPSMWEARTERGDRRLRLLVMLGTIGHGGGTGFAWSPRFDRNAASRTEGEIVDSSLAKPVEITLPQLTTEAGAKSYTTGPGAYARTRLMVPLGGLARLLHRLTGLEFVADGFIRARVEAGVVVPPGGPPRPLARLLDAVAAALRYDWSKEGNLIRLRSRQFTWDRPEEIPERILRPWLKHAGREEYLSLDDLAELAGALADGQCRGLEESWDWYTEGTALSQRNEGGFINRYRPDLRFWASLSPAQRRSALAGQPVPVGRMNAAQRLAFAAALAAPSGLDVEDSVWWVYPPPGRYTPEEIATGAFRAEAQDAAENARAVRDINGEQAWVPRFTVGFRYYIGGAAQPARAESIAGSLVTPEKLLGGPAPR